MEWYGAAETELALFFLCHVCFVCLEFFFVLVLYFRHRVVKFKHNKPPNVVDLTYVYKIFVTLNNIRKKNLNIRYYFKRTCLSKSTNLQGSLSAMMLQPYTIRWAGIATRYGLDDPGIECR